jgi:hypothetical protein
MLKLSFQSCYAGRHQGSARRRVATFQPARQECMLRLAGENQIADSVGFDRWELKQDSKTLQEDCLINA